MKLLKSGLTVRGDSVYCPLAFSLDSYWNCLTDCLHCYLRRLNQTWGQDLRPLDVEKFKKDLHNGIRNNNPQTPLAHCLSRKKTLRWGNKSDPFQLAERKHQIAKHVFPTLIQHKWTFVIQTMHTDVMMEYTDSILEANRDNLVTVMPIVSPGLDKDWEAFERKRTNPPRQRLHHLRQLMRRNVPCGVNGEPFIPGFHSPEDFEDTLKLLKSYGINRYNTYNFHLNAFVLKRLFHAGFDVEKIWFMNQDDQWKPILQQLLDLSKRYGIILGCPDFVNTGPDWVEKAGTCCGIDVPNPTTFNTHYWKRMAQEGKLPEEILNTTWDGSGEWKQAEAIVRGEKSEFYTLADAGVL